MGNKVKSTIGKMLKKDISEIVNNELCIACGACKAVCPFNAIDFQWRKNILIPEINNNCRHCSLCYKVCPGEKINFNNLNRENFGHISTDIRIGNYIKIWAGYSTDKLIRYKAASGGLVTALLIHALEEKIIDGAIVLGADQKNPLIPRAIIAKTKNEVIASCGSNYLSGSICSLISEIMKSKGKYAVVGQPCHLTALRKAELIMPKVKERVILHFGLFCQTKTTTTGLKFWLQVNKINPPDIAKFSFRGNGWPGGMTIKLKNRKNIFFPLPTYWQFLEKFSPKRCTLCTDALAEFADISFGDAWLKEFENDTKGTSIIVIRSPIGEKLVDNAVMKKKITGIYTTKDMLVNSQKVSLKFKKEGYYYRAKLFSFLGKKVPVYTGGYINKGDSSYLEAVTFYLKRWFFSREILWPLIYQWKKFLIRLMITKKRISSFVKAIATKILNSVLIILLKFNYFLLLRFISLRKIKPEKIKKILIINQADMQNKGDAAIWSGTMKVINLAFPKVKVTTVSHTPHIDIERCSSKVLPSYHFLKQGRILPSFLKTTKLLGFVVLYNLTGSLKIFHFPILCNFLNETFSEYAQADLVIHRGGDNLTDDYGIAYPYFESILISLLLRKPTVILGETIGPFINLTSKRLAYVILNKVDVIVTREILSVDNLKNLGIIKPKIFTLPDISFVLNPSDKKRLDYLLRNENLNNLKKPVIAISISDLVVKYGFTHITQDQKINNLIKALIQTIEYCRKEFGVSIVFITHVYSQGNDDRVISQQIINQLKDQSNVFLIRGEYSHEDYKAFLEKYADLFIGARMHANIAAVSVGVPTLALSYSQKTHGIIGEMFGQTDYIVDVRKIKDGKELSAEMISKINILWKKRTEIKKSLSERVSTVKKDVRNYARLLKTAVLQ